ncbi:A/G-specific adenine glycosylase [Humibacter ginsenosidimutans]|uniref:Adenine DNA glycosylase n=1 Tax=Humibacter ginsenosidimutans TaxID=2599293 RepID=A0A5B8M177_9MICO|nr:A/G-specific adenine glycosylase [Humibacter ginsenosidimutans]QDZ13440.1 A/G-specific adenine glycosylase [Humibacter ginsenosidimutans]
MSTVAALPRDEDDLVRTLNEWFRHAARDLPWRRAGFGAWGILVSEVMLQQTPVVRVIPRLAEWLERWPTPADLAATPQSEAIRAWAGLGYPRRALRLHACAVAIAERHDGIVPRDVDELLALPGIGDYTARAVAAFAYGDRHPVVDTNVRRVLARCIDGQGEPAPPNARRDLAAMDAVLPHGREEARVFNAAAMELGAVVCTARSPRCDVCPVADMCAWRAAGHPAYLGAKRAVQKKYEGSDRQVRGTLLRELGAVHRPLSAEELEPLWPDAAQRDRALAGLLADGLAVTTDEGYTLPQ